MIKRGKKDLLLDFLGILLIIIALLRFYSLYEYGTIIHIFWLCNHVPLLIGIFILFRKPYWLTAEFSLLFVGLLLWCINFLVVLVINNGLFNKMLYIFTVENNFFFYVSILQHFAILPIAFTALFLFKKPEPRAWRGAVLHGLILVPIIFFFGKQYNLNCFLESCVPGIPSHVFFYPIIFFIVYFGLFVIPINKLLTKLVKKPKIIKSIIYTMIGIIILISIILIARFLLPIQLDDVSPGISCSQELLEKADIYYVIPNFHNQSNIADNQTWCDYIKSFNKELRLHGVTHEYKEFKKDRDQEYIQQGINMFEQCFQESPNYFKPPQIWINKQNRQLIKESGLNIDWVFNQIFHKVYHCDDSGIPYNDFNDKL